MLCRHENLNAILSKLEKRESKMLLNNVLVYHSPFTYEEIGTMSVNAYHLIYITDNVNDIESASIGFWIEPKCPYYLTENDVVIEYYDNFARIYRVERVNGELRFLQKQSLLKNNKLLISYVKALMN